MNLWFRVFDQLRRLVAPHHLGHAEPTQAIEWVEQLAGKVLQQHQMVMALLDDRKNMRRALVGKAFDSGLHGRPEENEMVMDWPFDPSDHDADEPKVEAELELEAMRAKRKNEPAPRKLISLH